MSLNQVLVVLVEIVAVGFYPGIGALVFWAIRADYWRERHRAEAKGLVWPEA